MHLFIVSTVSTRMLCVHSECVRACAWQKGRNRSIWVSRLYLTFWPPYILYNVLMFTICDVFSFAQLLSYFASCESSQGSFDWFCYSYFMKRFSVFAPSIFFFFVFRTFPYRIRFDDEKIFQKLTSHTYLCKTFMRFYVKFYWFRWAKRR